MVVTTRETAEEKKRRLQAVPTAQESRVGRGAPIAPTTPKTSLQTAKPVARTSFFDPRRRGGVALLPFDPLAQKGKAIEAKTMDEATDIINAQLKARTEEAEAVPTEPVVGAVPPPTPAPPKPPKITPEQDIAEITKQAQARIAQIQAEPTTLDIQQAEIAQINVQARAEIADIKAEQKIAEDEKARLGKEFTQELLTERIDGARDLQATMAEKGQNISLKAAVNQWDSMQKFNSTTTFAQESEALDEKMASPTFERENAFQVATAEFGGNTQETEKYMKSRGFLATDIASQKEAWQKDFLNYTDEEIVANRISETKSGQQSIFLSGELTGVNLGSFLDNSEASKSPASFQNMLEVALASGNIDKDYVPLVQARLNLSKARVATEKREAERVDFVDLPAEDIAQNIFEGVGDIKDVLTKNRQPVLAKLNKLKQEALSAGDLQGVLKASAVHGDKNPSDTFLQSFSKGRSVLNQLGELKDLMFSEGYVDPATKEGIDLSPLSGWLAERNPWDTDSQKIKAILQQTIPNLARGVFGEVGVLTDRDVELYRKTLPNLRSTEAVQQAVLGITLKAVQKSLENQIETQALGGRNMSRFVSAYDDIVRKTDELMGLRDLPQGAIDAFNRADKKERVKMIEQAKNSFFRVQDLRGRLEEIRPGTREEVGTITETRPIRNNNPINVKRGGIADEFAEKNPDGTVKTDDQGHLIFANPKDGVKGAKADLKAKVEGRSRVVKKGATLAQLGSVFAEDPNWANGVARILGVDTTKKIEDIDFDELFQAVSRQEGGSALLTMNA